MNVNLLIVENEEGQVKLFRDAIEIFNKSATYPIQLDEAKSLEEGMGKLKSRSYDGAVVDLRLEQNDTIGQGNEIIKEIKSKLRFPVRVISGHLGDLDPELQSYNYLFKCVNRGEEDYDVILTEFADIFSTGITSILNNKGLIESNINSVFWKHISMVLPEFVNLKKQKPDANVEKILLRYISLHLLEYLELNINNDFESVQNIELYIKPPIRSKIFTGDIVKHKYENSHWLVLTPACDLATDEYRATPKAKFITLANIVSYKTVINGRSQDQIKLLEKNNLDYKYHYLPKTILYDGGFINFQHLISIPTKCVLEEFEVECVVTSPFKKDIISRFASYFSRQGQPSFD